MAKAKSPVSRSSASTASKKAAASRTSAAAASSAKATASKVEAAGDKVASTSSAKPTDAGSVKTPPVGAKTPDLAKVEKPDVVDVKDVAEGKKVSAETKAPETPKVETKPAAAKPVETKEPTKTVAARDSSKPAETKKPDETKTAPDDKAPSDTKSPFATKETAETKATPEAKEPPKFERPKPVAPPPAAPEKSGSIFIPLVVGGFIAGALGFFAAEMDLLGNRAQTVEMQRSISEQQTRLSALEQAEPVAAEVKFPALDELSANYASLSAQLADFETRLTIVEEQPVAGGSSTPDVAVYEGELAALQASVEKQRAEIEGLLNNALSVEEATEKAARSARLQGAITQITTAISEGQPFEDAVAVLKQDGMENLPAALNDAAASGVVTLNNLQSRFPDNARAALAAVRAAGEDEEAPGVGGFLRRQLGARSVTPREGDNPDAVLSRAEVAVRDGRLEDGLSDLDKLPQAGQDAMQEWLADARARQAVQVATQDLSQSLSAN